MDGRAGSNCVSEQVQQGRAVVGFVVSAVPAHLIMQVADADLILPAKVKDVLMFIHNMNSAPIVCALCVKYVLLVVRCSRRFRFYSLHSCYFFCTGNVF